MMLLGVCDQSSPRACTHQLILLSSPFSLPLSSPGQFGVGFYSAFMVGDSVEVTSRSYSAEEPGHTWKSTGAGSYVIGPLEAGQEGRG